jgi:type III pantothenate kinase
MPHSIVAVDIGNARIKLGRFAAEHGTPLPEPEQILSLDGRKPDLTELAAWLTAAGGDFLACHWWIASVNRPATTRLVDWLREHRPDDPLTMLSAGDLPLVVDLDRPDMVGVDRLVDAVAANHLRTPGHPAVVVDMGTAITVDLISADGAFCGGAILPGIEMAARAMHEFTDLLPLVEMSELDEPPAALGTSTVEAMRSGLYWLAVGAVRELTARLSQESDQPPEVFLTGGAGPAISAAVGGRARLVPHLTLAGIALAARSSRE